MDINKRAAAKAAVEIVWMVIYVIAGVGLILGTKWGYKLAWFPGVLFVYHSISFWFWTRNQRRFWNKLISCFVVAKFITGVLAISIAWNANF